MNDRLIYLVSAYASIWLIIGFYVFTLVQRNQRLSKLVVKLENRLQKLEQGRSQSKQ